MNNTVTVYFEDDDEEETIIKLSQPSAANSLKNLISNESPLGKALIGAQNR